jgi:hypothetical protein
MAKVSFASMKLKVNEAVNVIDLFGKEVEVKQYLPIEDKNSLCEIALQAATGGTVFNSLLAEAYFNTYIIIEYTNINFTDNQKADVLKLYDILDSNGIIDTVIEAIPKEEYITLYESFTEMTKNINKYMTSAKAIADDIMQYAPNKSAEITANLADFDEEKFANVIKIAQDTNMK